MIYLVIICMFITVLFQSKGSLHMLQQNLYNENNRYLKWIGKNYHIFINVELLSILFIIYLIYINTDIINIIYILLILIYLFEVICIKKRLLSSQEKKPLVYTARVKRLIFTTCILYIIPFIFIYYYRYNIDFVLKMLLLLAVMVYLNYFVVWISNIINKPFEKCVYYKFLNQAKNKLRNITGLKVIGITGSYGKTSSKNILADILNYKYNTLPTPKNLNTPNGLMITINNHMDKFCEVFIAEMGAYKMGEIKELCDFVHPKYGILTRIGTAHLETFGSEANIQKGKFELIESLPSDGIGVLNGDDPKQVNYKLRNDVKIIWIGIDNHDVDVYASNIKCSHKGTTFDVTFKGDKKKYKFQTKLLGNHNVYNILAGIALGREFGIKIDELISAVKGVRPVEHRLEIKPLNGFYMIDDAYNSNPVGAKGAVEVLGMMPGKKVVVTPGMIELGSKEAHYNKEFGRQIADVADYVVLIGEKHTKPIYKGLIEKKFKKDKIIIYNDVRDAYTFISTLIGKEDVYALFENDLPDTYSEN